MKDNTEGENMKNKKTTEPKGCAVITGTSGGLGLALAKLFAADGYELLLVARNADKLDAIRTELSEHYGVTVHVVAEDLTDTNAAQTVYDYVSEKCLTVTALVNNAGFGDFGAYASVDWDRQKAMVDLNVLALMHLTHLFLPAMQNRGQGKILNIASIAAFQPGPLMSVYYASKAFVLSFSEAICRELKGTGVTVTALCPGPIRTGFEDAARLGKSGLFKNIKPSSPEKVALFGYKKMQKGKAVAVHRASNRFLVFVSRFVSRGIVRNTVYNIMKEKK